MISLADESFKSDHKLAPFHERSAHRHAKALFDKLRARHLGQGEENFPAFAMFLVTQI